MSFQIHALDPARFQPLFALDNQALTAHHARWQEVDSCPGFPCRISLKDAPVGRRVLLVNFTHLETTSPYRACHAIFVDPQATRATPEVGQVPESLSSRLISWRAFDHRGIMLQADVLEGIELAKSLPIILRDPKIVDIHLHNARPGCYAARVTRAS